MSITFTCPNCEKQYQVKDEFGGRTVVCKKCKTKIAIEANGKSSIKSSETSNIASRRKKHDDQEKIKRVAMYQKGVLVCLLLQLMAIAGALAGPMAIQALLGYGLIVLFFAGAVFVLLLAMICYGTSTGVVAGIVALIPCIGVIVLLIVNNSATKLLKKEGIRVGLLGADLSQI